MSSLIDPTKPTATAATTASVRANFTAAKNEIEALQSGKADLSGAAFSGAVTAPTPTAGDSSTSVATTAFVAGNTAGLQGFISGLTLLNGPSDLVNDIQVSTGVATDSTNVSLMTLAAALIKQLDVNWAVGTNQGGLDTGAIANADYYIWLIKRQDTGVVDALFSLSSTAPTMPTNYTLKRLVGWIKRLAGTIVAFHSYETAGGGLEINWDLPIDSVNINNTLTTTRRTDAMRVPLNFSVIANLSIDAADNTAQYYIRVMCPDETDAAIIGNNANMSGAIGTEQTMQLQVRTGATGLVASRSSLATVDAFIIRTTGFTWSRRN